MPARSTFCCAKAPSAMPPRINLRTPYFEPVAHCHIALPLHWRQTLKVCQQHAAVGILGDIADMLDQQFPQSLRWRQVHRADLVERSEADRDAFDVAVIKDVLLVFEIIVEVAFHQPEPVGDVAHGQRGKLAGRARRTRDCAKSDLCARRRWRAYPSATRSPELDIEAFNGALQNVSVCV